jgi:ferredoxin
VTEWRISVDGDRCIGSGLCAANAPGSFRVVDGRSEPVTDRVTPADDVIEAADLCPMEAISVRDAATGEPVSTDPGGVVW